MHLKNSKRIVGKKHGGYALKGIRITWPLFKIEQEIILGVRIVLIKKYYKVIMI
jgi:hypothetical protein